MTTVVLRNMFWKKTCQGLKLLNTESLTIKIIVCVCNAFMFPKQGTFFKNGRKNRCTTIDISEVQILSLKRNSQTIRVTT